jgi:hypothetical protein
MSWLRELGAMVMGATHPSALPDRLAALMHRHGVLASALLEADLSAPRRLSALVELGGIEISLMGRLWALRPIHDRRIGREAGKVVENPNGRGPRGTTDRGSIRQAVAVRGTFNWAHKQTAGRSASAKTVRKLEYQAPEMFHRGTHKGDGVSKMLHNELSVDAQHVIAEATEFPITPRVTIPEPPHDPFGDDLTPAPDGGGACDPEPNKCGGRMVTWWC